MGVVEGGCVELRAVQLTLTLTLTRCALVCLVLGVLLITLEAQPSAQACHTRTDA